ncbi:radical SAM-associated putative lipoprotein [Tannerella sp.]|uniref:radical SAM-associated putative lipoprotein n=1 Tax=Tannerella sp. TaxID=2382127 RepID=UPI003FA32230
MKKIGRKFLKGTNWALAGLLSFLGFSGCDIVGGVEYGTPHAEYEVKGTITNEAGKNIPDIQVKLAQGKRGGYIESGITVKTDEMGHYSASVTTFPGKDFVMIVTDTDGETNGSYASDTIAVRFEEKDYYKKGKGWFEGAARKKVDIKLKPKK